MDYTSNLQSARSKTRFLGIFIPIVQFWWQIIIPRNYRKTNTCLLSVSTGPITLRISGNFTRTSVSKPYMKEKLAHDHRFVDGNNYQKMHASQNLHIHKNIVARYVTSTLQYGESDTPIRGYGHIQYGRNTRIRIRSNPVRRALVYGKK